MSFFDSSVLHCPRFFLKFVFVLFEMAKQNHLRLTLWLHRVQVSTKLKTENRVLISQLVVMPFTSYFITVCQTSGLWVWGDCSHNGTILLLYVWQSSGSPSTQTNFLVWSASFITHHNPPPPPLPPPHPCMNGLVCIVSSITTIF